MLRRKKREELSKKEKIRREIIDFIFWTVALVFVFGGLVMPETGAWCMLNESWGVILLLVGAISCLCGGIRKRKEDKTALLLGVGLAVVLFGICGWMSRKIVLDLIDGPQVMRLTSVTTDEYHGIHGLVSHSYYLCGTDENWKTYQFEISADEYYELEGEGQIIVLCYPRTERILKFL